MRIVNYRRSSAARAPLREVDRMSTLEKSIGEACAFMLSVELAFGGRVNEELTTAEQLVLITPVFGSVDDTVFTGTPEEMSKLYSVLVAYHEVRGTPEMKKKLMGVMQAFVNHPSIKQHLGFVSEGAPIIAGGPTARSTAVAMMAKTTKDVESFNKLREKDLYALLAMFIDGTPRNEIMELAA